MTRCSNGFIVKIMMSLFALTAIAMPLSTGAGTMVAYAADGGSVDGVAIAAGSATAELSETAAEAESQKLNALLPLIGSALAAASQERWADASEKIGEAESIWGEVELSSIAGEADVDSAFANAGMLLGDEKVDKDVAKASLTELARAINTYMKAAKGEDGSSDDAGKTAASELLPLAEQLRSEVLAGSWEEANGVYKEINNHWPDIESSIRSDNFAVYGKLETAMSMIRIAIQAEPPRAEQAANQAGSLVELLTDYRDGKLEEEEAPAEKLDAADLIVILDKAARDIESGYYAEAEGQMDEFISSWPLVEGQVRIYSASAYTKVETIMTDVARYLDADPRDTDKAFGVIAELRETLGPLTEDQTYTAWDAGLILLREGLEAILVIAALLAYLRRTDNHAKAVWIWSGVWTGLALSLGVAVLLTNVIAQATAGSAREAMEGITGLVSVVLMITVGNWLHSKSNLKAWNSYIDGKMGSALAKGSLWSLFFVSMLAIMREGAETTIFYVGMAASIDGLQMIIGIVVTLAVLVVLGYAIIRFSSVLPIRPFFLVASGLIYYLVIRFIGESIHSLQVASWIPVHASDSLPTWGFIGAYPTWETTVPQLAVLLVVVGRYAIGRKAAK
ncbi:FTR1 family protein [Paenibacillus sp. HB172176]|uniref:FTR1 family iron permease n=1 Tax=Paenibacillus sp. HB172176 TaxID=2493690 RepID=UPI001F0DAC66|nr:FTR1 family protein [Paenibacillus sp. HB172176]